MAATLFTLPRELRDEIYTDIALNSSFAFLLACRQLNEEGTPLLYKYGTYRLRALILRRERLPAAPKPSPISMIQNLYISMPPMRFGDRRSPNFEIPLRTARMLSQFAGTGIRRRLCHLDLQTWTLSARMAKVLSGFRGFEVVRVEVRLKQYHSEPDGRRRPYDWDVVDEERAECIQLIEDKLGAALGEAKWEERDSGSCFEELLVADFLPGMSTV